MDRRAWWATVHRASKSRTRLKLPSMHAPTLELGMDDSVCTQGHGRNEWAGVRVRHAQCPQGRGEMKPRPRRRRGRQGK